MAQPPYRVPYKSGWIAVTFAENLTAEERAAAVKEIGGKFCDNEDGSELVNYLIVPEGQEEECLKRANIHSAITGAALRYS